jgi:hypothetical protein
VCRTRHTNIRRRDAWFMRPGKPYFKYGIVPVGWVISVSCYRLWIFGMNEIIEVKCSDRAALQHKETGRTLLVQPVADEGNTQNSQQCIIKIQHIDVTEMHIKLTVKRNAIENIQLLYQMPHSLKSGPQLRRSFIKILLQIRRFCKVIVN